jgi:hypothetical protein
MESKAPHAANEFPEGRGNFYPGGFAGVVRLMKVTSEQERKNATADCRAKYARYRVGG